MNFEHQLFPTLLFAGCQQIEQGILQLIGISQSFRPQKYILSQLVLLTMISFVL
jgi:hypothetical protein